ncbi:hypothetical protein LZ575_11295 [Antarcticibacterium sp. 1MA-6-2]|uniref:protein-disulfide reductase DsbD domain-containing protein n=1 Tax=Antarcticibacterium sp. 1MA-6-2 TaxID=2908210 RepID=UPI001F18AB51|nr:protein-disulfide reductase DsbD domain-containing protein [Antarcticibacterium sp. 1MA-6-2]UJH89669.1 hypothetical protein LZ575_11295 [Antarcticibacterium sp. 1MA-6-2]
MRYSLVGQKRKYDAIWEGEYTYFTETAKFNQEVLIKKEAPEFRGSIFYQICSDVSGQCIPFETDFAFDSTGNNIAATGNKESEIENSRIYDMFSSRENGIIEESENVSAVENMKSLEPFQNSFKDESEDIDQGWTGLLAFFFISFGA